MPKIRHYLGIEGDCAALVDEFCNLVAYREDGNVERLLSENVSDRSGVRCGCGCSFYETPPTIDGVAVKTFPHNNGSEFAKGEKRQLSMLSNGVGRAYLLAVFMAALDGCRTLSDVEAAAIKGYRCAVEDARGKRAQSI